MSPREKIFEVNHFCFESRAALRAENAPIIPGKKFRFTNLNRLVTVTGGENSVRDPNSSPERNFGARQSHHAHSTVVERLRDLKDFSYLIEDELKLTWGAGRAVFFEYENRWWMIAHGIPQPFNGADGHRQLFLTPVDPRDLQ
jgi:hypothetical protein